MKEPIQCGWYSDQVVGWMAWGSICSRGKKLFPSSKHADWLWILPISRFSCTGDSFIGSKVTGEWSWLNISILWQNWEWVELYTYKLVPFLCLHDVHRDNFSATIFEVRRNEICHFSCTGDSFIGSKVTGVWSWLNISFQWQNWEWVELYIYIYIYK